PGEARRRGRSAVRTSMRRHRFPVPGSIRLRGATSKKARHAPGFLLRSTKAAGALLAFVQPGHADDVVAAVDIGDLAGDARGQVRTQERGGVADVLDRDRAPDRRVRLDVAEDLAEAADPGGGQGL